MIVTKNKVFSMLKNNNVYKSSIKYEEKEMIEKEPIGIEKDSVGEKAL